MDPKKILLVEDDPQDVELTLFALNEYNLGKDTQVVHNGVEALDYLYRKGKFREVPAGLPVAILLDLKLPKLDGVGVLRRLKSDPKLQSIPVVILSSSCEGPDMRACYELGANDYIVKPVKFERFIEEVKRICIFWILVTEPPARSWRRNRITN